MQSKCFRCANVTVPSSFFLANLRLHPQRLKGAIDSRIAEEQAKARIPSTSPSRAPSTARRSAAQAGEKKTRSKPRVDDDGSRGPDPSEFEGAFVIDDESEPPSRVGTPAIGAENTDQMAEKGAEAGEEVKEKMSEVTPQNQVSSPASTELPAEVRTKLRKLEKLESRYQGESGMV